jgi:zinc/manganese transport system substrate-binding protein
MIRRLMTLAVLLSLAGASCGDDGSAGEELPLVVVTTNLLGDVVNNVVGDLARVEVLMPMGVDPHDFEPSSRQAALITESDLVVANGLGLEEGLEDVIDAARGDGAVILEVADLVDPLPFGAVADGDGDLDPHVWMDPIRMAQAARLIADRLADFDPSVDWDSGADAYAAQLETAHERIDALLSAVPLDRRLLVTNHEVLGYFAARYGFEVVGVVIPGGSTLAEPGSEELAALVAVIDELNIQAVFAETTEPSTLARAIADEADHPVAVVTLHTESLGEPGSPADTLIGMLEENARLIVDALT